MQDINGREVKNGDAIVAMSEELDGKRHMLGGYVGKDGLPCKYGEGQFVANITHVDLPKNFKILDL